MSDQESAAAQIQAYINLFSQIYDYFLTLDQEISEFWHRKFSLASLLFYINRYLFWALVVMQLFFVTYPLDDVSCNVIGRVQDSSSLVTLLAVILIFTLRTWAIYLKDWKILAVVGLAGAAKLSVNLIIVISSSGYFSLPGDVCGHNPSPGYDDLTKASGFLSMTFDTVTFWLTFYKTVGAAIQMRKFGMTDSLTYFLLRDVRKGRLILNGVAVTSVLTTKVPAMSPESQMILTSLTGSLTNIMVNHLLLNLRQISHADMCLTSSDKDHRTLTVPEFASDPILGNIGAPLRQSSSDIQLEQEDYDIFDVESPTKVSTFALAGRQSSSTPPPPDISRIHKLQTGEDKG
ncbi:hypothetical protein BD410DRAFT_854265 [Rickenella mellea]|uniref:DUF6533 domain-containing protein n=1 Tax=Rickenella mellea TaxID=50990 RepID=A0A4Y7QAB2_9AGAM|nr:hypothetical protein BD410DRAFT_854265 [Rickenella mellea]